MCRRVRVAVDTGQPVNPYAVACRVVVVRFLPRLPRASSPSPQVVVVVVVVVVPPTYERSFPLSACLFLRRRPPAFRGRAALDGCALERVPDGGAPWMDHGGCSGFTRDGAPPRAASRFVGAGYTTFHVDCT